VRLDEPLTSPASHHAPLLPLDRRGLLGVALLGLLLYVPLAGSYGLWDPWETHYGEVARTMLERGDFLTTYWQDEVFKSKPVLTFWMQAAGMAAFGLGRDGGPSSEMALGHAAEWGMRLPFILVSVFGLVILFLLVSRVVSRRAGFLAAAVCATAPQYALITRQSITDIPFVSLMTAGMSLFFLGLLVDPEERPHSVSFRLLGRQVTLSTWHLFSFLLLALTLPQLYLVGLDIGWQHERTIVLGHNFVFRLFGLQHIAIRLFGLPYIVPWFALLLLYFASTWRAEGRRASHLYIHAAWMLCALAVLAKGLGGIMIPVAVVGLFILATRERRLLGRLEILRGLAIFFAVAAPWHHAMWIRHGSAFWNEYFGHHHFKRAEIGVHGERGTFEYYLHQLGMGFFPWSGLVPAVLVRWSGMLRPATDRRTRLVLYTTLWAVVTFALFAIMETKFHHYPLPAIPPLAILVGVWLDEILTTRERSVKAPEDGCLFPASRSAWAHTAPHVLLVLLCAGVIALITRDLVRDPSHLVLLFIYKYDRLFPYELHFEPWMGALGGLAVASTLALLVPRIRRIAVWSLVGSATLFAIFTIDHYLVALSPHWGQKNLHEIYFRARSGPEERLIAWQLNWRGENYYSKNQVIVHMQPKETPKFKAFLRRHHGERFYLIMEQGRLGSFKAILKSLGVEKSLEIVGPGGKTWPDNWVPHFRVERIKVLYRERATLSKRCRAWKRRLWGIKIPSGAARFRGSAMANNWWGGHCSKFLRAERQEWRRRCGAGAPRGTTDRECDDLSSRVRRHAKLCRQVRDALGPYPYLECFEEYPNNKFLLVRFRP